MNELPKKMAHLQGSAREVGGGEVGGVRVEGRGCGGVAVGFGTVVKVEGGWGGEGEEVGGFVFREEMVSARKAIFLAVADLRCASLHLTSLSCLSTRACFASMSFSPLAWPCRL